MPITQALDLDNISPKEIEAITFDHSHTSWREIKEYLESFTERNQAYQTFDDLAALVASTDKWEDAYDLVDFLACQDLEVSSETALKLRTFGRTVVHALAI